MVIHFTFKCSKQKDLYIQDLHIFPSNVQRNTREQCQYLMTNSAPTSVFVILPHPEPLIWLQLFSTAVYLHCKGLAQEQPCAQFPHVLGKNCQDIKFRITQDSLNTVCQYRKLLSSLRPSRCSLYILLEVNTLEFKAIRFMPTTQLVFP